MGFWATCTLCGASNFVDLDFQLITVSGNARGNFGVRCRVCRRTFDAAPVDGTYSTIAGRLQLIRAATRELARLDTDALQELAETLERANESGDQGAAQDALSAAGLGALLASQGNRMELATWLALLVTIIGVVLGVRAAGGGSDRPPGSPDEVNEVCRIVEKQTTESLDPATGQVVNRQTSEREVVVKGPGRNRLCPCGSGAKYKRCHGSASSKPPGR